MQVDINQALAGIDKLLKSQELTFAFVGVAPALAIVYGAVGYFRNVWSGGRGRGRYGGKARRSSVWLTMRYVFLPFSSLFLCGCAVMLICTRLRLARTRRLERLLVAQPSSHHHRAHPVPSMQKAASVSPLTAGLVLLSVTHLRQYAETTLPANSRMREGFLEDVADLEDPGLGRSEKLRVLDRMWRSWGEPLGWNRIAA